MWGNISEDVKGAGELKIFQGTHVFSNGHGHENTAGLKNSRGRRPGGTFTGSVLEGCDDLPHNVLPKICTYQQN